MRITLFLKDLKHQEMFLIMSKKEVFKKIKKLNRLWKMTYKMIKKKANKYFREKLINYQTHLNLMMKMTMMIRGTLEEE
jgi:hypothetical protein